MSEQTLKRLFGALFIAVALWLVTRLFAGGDGGIRATGDLARFFESMVEDSIDAVRIMRPSDTVELRRADGAWTVNGWEAGEGAIERFTTALAEAEVGDLVANNPANHARMGVSADSAATLEVRLGDETRTLLVGDQGQRFGTAYVRLPDADGVYLLDGDLRGHVRRGVDEWRDTEIVAVDSARIARLEIERDGDAYTLVRADSVWTFEDGGAVDEIQARNVLTELSSMIAAGFLAEADSLYALPQGGATTAYDAEGQVLAELTIGSGEGERWARAAGDSIVYRLSTFRVGRIAPTREAMEPSVDVEGDPLRQR